MKNLQQYIQTDRLNLKMLEYSDSSFILELVNTEGWLKFIGNRNVQNEKEALNYIQKINSDVAVNYWVVQADKSSVGIISLIKRAHLLHSDIGFAFLPRYEGQGYAFEAAKAVLDQLVGAQDFKRILATTDPGNKRSIRLIEKLGFSYYKAQLIEGQESRLYALDIGR